MRHAILLALAVLVLPAAQAAAQEGAAARTPTTPPYMIKVQSGLRLAVARDFDGAIAALREAVQLSPSLPRAHYHLGEVQRMQGQLAQALETFRTAQRIAEQANEPAWQARAMQGVAETLERQPHQLAAARQAWAEYARFADANRSVSVPEVARARMQAIDAALAQERAYVAVRERIAERERINAAGGSPRQGQRRGQ